MSGLGPLRGPCPDDDLGRDIDIAVGFAPVTDYSGVPLPRPVGGQSGDVAGALVLHLEEASSSRSLFLEVEDEGGGDVARLAAHRVRKRNSAVIDSWRKTNGNVDIPAEVIIKTRPSESFLFNCSKALESDHPEIGPSNRESTTPLVVSGAPFS